MPYLDTDGVESAIASLASSYFGARLVELPNPSYEQFTSHALHISFPSANSKVTVLLLGGIHANEWGSADIAVSFAADLLDAHANPAGLRYGRAVFGKQAVASLLDRVNFVIFPLVNPDGRRYSLAGETGWRKNRNGNYGPSRALSGVDINRNFDFLFNYRKAFVPDCGVSASDTEGDSNFQGEGAFSEPETENVRWLLDEFPEIGLMIDLHSDGEQVLYPWGSDESQSNDATMTFRNPDCDGERGMPGDAYGEHIDQADATSMKALAQAFAASAASARGTQYAVAPQYKLYPTCGTSHDYAFSRHLVQPPVGQKVQALVVEWGDEKQPDWEEMAEIVRDVSAGLIGLCRAL